VFPLSTVLFPRLAKAFAQSYREGSRILWRYGSCLFAASLLVVVGVTLFTDAIVSTVFVRGRFTLQDSFRTAELLQIMVLALPLMSIGDLLRYALYSMSFYRASIYSNVIMWCILAMVGWLLVPDLGAVGLAWATVSALGAQTIAMVIMILLHRRDGDYVET
jgi:putative peptidoglycan lipid II flippase